MDETRTIQQVALETGLSEHTLRYYERVGLIESVDRADNGHRRYTEQDIGWIEFLKCLRATGMPVIQMKQFADLTRSDQPNIDQRLALLEGHRRDVLEKIDELRQYLSVIEYKIDYYTAMREPN